MCACDVLKWLLLEDKSSILSQWFKFLDLSLPLHVWNNKKMATMETVFQTLHPPPHTHTWFLCDSTFMSQLSAYSFTMCLSADFCFNGTEPEAINCSNVYIAFPYVCIFCHWIPFNFHPLYNRNMPHLFIVIVHLINCTLLAFLT